MAWLVAGLGNPGPRYAGHRHNIGFMVLEELAGRGAVGWRDKFNGRFARMRSAQEDMVLLEPMTWMNRSGISVGAAATFFKVPTERTVVVHDELDLPFGRLRVKVGGGHGGHNGLRSIFEHFGKDFVRVRCGIGRPARGEPTSWVLGDFDEGQRAVLPRLIDAAADAVERVVRDGALEAMNEWNRLDGVT